MLKRSSEDARGVVSAQWDQVPLLCGGVPVVLVRPKEQEPPENEAIQRRSRCDRSVLLPWLECMHTRNACGYSTPDDCGWRRDYSLHHHSRTVHDRFPSYGSSVYGHL